MKISFDLDDTLICSQEFVPREPNKVPFFLKLWIKDPMRLGTVKLLKELEKCGHEIWIYTTSYRSPCYIKLWLYCYGIHIKKDRIINQIIHNKNLRRNSHDPLPSKNPRAFGIDLHVDDSEGVRIEGEKYNFTVISVSSKNEFWSDHVLNFVKSR